MPPPKFASSQQMKLSSFFNVTPKPSKNNDPEKPKEAEKRPADPDNYEDIWSSPKLPKRKRVVLSSDEETENMSVNNEQPMTPGSACLTPKSTARAPLCMKFQREGSMSNTPNSAQRASAFINSFRYNKSDAANGSTSDNVDGSRILTPHRTPSKNKTLAQSEDEGEMLHLTFNFLKPEKIKDADGRLANDPDYDPRTLHVPFDFMQSQTPGHKQWWQIKSQLFDTVLFFKVGKFYEMYHMDAVVGVENLGLVYMRGKYAHCGFPEGAFGIFAERLIRKGYKVARVEQTETPEQMEERNMKNRTKDKAVRREVCRITTQATQTYSSFDCPREDDKVNTGKPDSNYLLSICERKNTEEGPTKTRFGVAFVDCTVGQFYLCEFVDDNSFSILRTLLAHNQPTQILQPRNGLSQLTIAVISSILGPVPKESLKHKEFLAANETLKWLKDDDYLGTSVYEWPKALSNLIVDLDEAIPKAKPEHELALSALGAILWYLKKCLIDVDLVTMRKFEVYTPISILDGLKNIPSADRWTGRRMILDGFALNSLHLLPSNDLLRQRRTVLEDKDSQAFSLFNTINHCVTPFGRRLLRQWICAPTTDAKTLKERQQSILFLCNPESKALVEFGRNLLKKVPDLDRLFQRIHTLGLKYRSEKHPDSRAQFFDAARYNSRKVRDLMVTLGGLEQLQKLMVYFCKNYQNEHDCPALITKCVGNKYDDMKADLDHFDKLIVDREKVAKEGRIVPGKGIDPDYDQSLRDVDEAGEQLEHYLVQQQKKLKSSKINFFGSGKNRYQLEIPEELTDRLGSDYELKSKRKGFKRYRTPELEELIKNLVDMEKQRDGLLNDSTRRVFADFDARKNKWARVVSQMATFDCLLSLACYNSKSSLHMCMPEFDFESSEPYLDICEGYHPSLASGSGVLASSEYIPNGIQLGGKSTPPILLLTGANMGGKSTLMRQTAVLVVLAQIGSLVPAKSMRLTPVDRVFSRIGASDCLAAGQSTFYIELQETNVILQQASIHSLIDELGRGTSTFDGTAIASAVLDDLAERVRCRTLFSTHYHSLCAEFADNRGVALSHMSCLVENDDLNGDPSMDNITFLYTLAAGPSPKSYGFFTARMAGIDLNLVRRAYHCSKLIDANNGDNCLHKLRELVSAVKEDQIGNDELFEAIKAV